MKVKTSKGFTLAELLIVMAIIVVLAAVAIPTFTRQLETARESSDLEVIRNAYTEAYTQAIQDVAVDGDLDTEEITVTDLEFVQAKAGFDYLSGKVGGVGVTDIDGSTATGQNQVKFTFDLSDDGVLSCTAIETGSGSSGGGGTTGGTTPP